MTFSRVVVILFYNNFMRGSNALSNSELLSYARLMGLELHDDLLFLSFLLKGCQPLRLGSFDIILRR